MIKTITEGYVYEVANANNPTLNQQIKFIQTHGGKVIQDGMNVTDLVGVLINKLEYDDTFEPCYENVISITLLKSTLNHQQQKLQPKNG